MHNSKSILLLAVLVAGFALCHGYAHGAEMPLESSPAGYALGFVVATLVLTLVGMAIVRALDGIGQPGGLRIRQGIGAVVALVGLAMVSGWI